MAIEEVRIKVTSDTKGADETIKKLEQIGAVDKKNADNFKKHNAQNQAQFKQTASVAGQTAGHIEQQFANLGAQIMGYMALDKLVGFLKDSVHEFVEAEKNAARLGFAIETIGGQSATATQRLIEQSKALQENSIFSDDSIQQTQTALATYGLTAEQIEALIPQVMDLAAASGTDLATATDRVIQGINGQTRGLKEVGIQYKDTGDKTQNLAILTEKLTKFQGASAEAMTTTAGKAEILSNRFGEMKESVGEFLVTSGSEILDFMDALFGKATMADYALQQMRQNAEKHVGAATSAFMQTIEGLPIEEQIVKVQNAMAKVAADATQASEDYSAGLIDADRFNQKIVDLTARRVDLQKELNRLMQGEPCPLGFHKNENGECVKDEDGGIGTTEKLKDLTDQINAIYAQMYADQLTQQKNWRTQQAVLEKKQAEEQITDSVERAQAILAIDQKLFDDLLAIDQLAINQKADTDIEKAKKEKATQEQISELVIAINLKRNQDLAALDQKYADDRLKNETDNWEAMLAQLVDEQEELYQQDKRNQEKLRALEDERFKETQELRIARTKEGSRERALAEQKNLTENFQLELATLEANHDQGLIAEEDYLRKRELLYAKYNQAIADSNKALMEKQKQEFIDLFSGIAEIIFDSIGEIIKRNIELIDRQESMVRDQIEHQRRLAEQGEENTLAQTERQYAELERQRMIQVEKARKAKELEILLNAILSYTQKGDDPGIAIGKALTAMALVKGAEALYMEKGGIIGETGEKSRVGFGFSRLHPGGGDRLVHAQDGEGILSRDEMANLGKSGFYELKAMLSKPLREVALPDVKAIITQGITKQEMAEGFNMVADVIRNKKETNFDVDKFGNWVITTTENGMKDVVTHIMRKPRI